MAAKRITFEQDAKSLVLDTSENYGIGQYFYIKEDGADGSEEEYNQNGCMKLSISRISYKKTIYKPGYANVEMTIDNFSSFQNKKYIDALKVYFLRGHRTLELKDSKSNNIHGYIEGYYITDLGFTQKFIDGSRVTVVVLKAYSPDYFLTLNKYSQAYRGKTLSKIIEDTLDRTFSGDASILKDRFHHENLCHTTENKNVANELKQPYLVQYNESFHDFVVRTANRCGELFYYEDGKLILGVDENNISTTNSTKDINIKGAIDGALPEEMVFSTIPGAFIKNVKTLNKTYLADDSKAFDTASSGELYINQNIEYADAFHKTDKNTESMTYDDITECHKLEIGNKILGASGLFDAISGATAKAADIKVTGESIASGWLMEDKSKITIQQCEEDLNNFYHSSVSPIGNDTETEAIFKANYEKEHPEEFTEPKTEDFQAFDYDYTIASIELKNYIKLAKNASRYHEQDWKDSYKQDHPEEFSKKQKLEDDKDIFAAGTKGKELLDKFIEDNTIRINNNQEEINKFKQEYEAGRGYEEFKGKSANARKNIWFNPESQAYKDLEAALSAAGLPPTDADIANAKTQIKQDNPDVCEKSVPMSEEEIQKMFDDKESAYRKNYEIYMKTSGNAYNEIIKTEKSIETGNCSEYFKQLRSEEEPSVTDDTFYTEAWKDSLSNPKDSKKNPPYNELVKKFKDQYKEDHPNEFKTTSMKEIDDKSKVWGNENSSAAKALKSYLANKQDKSNFSNSFYAWIEQSEKMNSESIQRHRLSDDKIPEYKLGEYYNLANSSDNQVYIVNQVEVNIYAESSGQSTSANGTSPVYKVDANIAISQTRQDKGRQETQDYQSKTFPPLADIPHIRKAEPQVAIVTDVADPQRAGRVQISYPWMAKTETPTDANGTPLKNVKGEDAKGQTSPWIPVLTPFSGSGESGFFMSPDKNDMVMVNYEGGNIERPYVDGSVYYGTGRPFWGSTPLLAKALGFRNGKHAISYQGNGITFVPGSKDAFIGNMLPSVIGGPLMKAWGKETDETSTGYKLTHDSKFGGGLVLSDHYGMYNISMSSATRSVNIESPWGNVGINAFTGITISAPNGDIKISGKNVTIEAGNKVSISSGKNIKSGKKKFSNEVISAIGGAAGSVGGSFIKNSLKTLTGIDLGKALDLSFLRNIWEIIFRPVDGGLSLASRRNLLMTAGPGKATIPGNTLSDAYVPKKMGSINPIKLAFNYFRDSTGLNGTEADQAWKNPGADLATVAKAYITKVDNEMEKVKTSFEKINQHFTSISMELTGYSEFLVKDYNTMDKLKALILNKSNFVGKDILKPLVVIDEHDLAESILNGAKVDAANNIASLCNMIVKLLGQIEVDIDNMKQAVCDVRPHYWRNIDLGKVGWSKLKPGDISFDNVKEQIFNFINSDEDRLEYIRLGSYNFAAAANQLKLNVIIAIAAKSQLFKYNHGTDEAPDWQPLTSADIALANNNFDNIKDVLKTRVKVDPPKKDDPSGFMSGLQTAVGSILKGAGAGDLISYDDEKDEWSFLGELKKTFNINGAGGPRSIWDASSGKGKIIMSCNKDASYTLEGSGETISLTKTARTESWAATVDRTFKP